MTETDQVAPVAPVAPVQDKSLSREALDRTVVSYPPAENQTSQVLTLLLAHEADEIPAWGTDYVTRDRKLRELATAEPTLAGALATVAARNAAMTVQFDGPKKTVQAVEDLWHSADGGAGGVSWVVKLSLDLYNQDNGAFPEWIRSEYISAEEALRRSQSGKPLPPVVGLGHLDAGCCTRTGNPLYPVIYVDPDDPRQERHLLPWHTVSPMSEMPSPNKLQRGRQMCAVSRVLKAAQLMRDEMILRREKVSGQNASEIQIVGGPSRPELEDAMARAREHAANRGYLRYMDPVIVASLDPTKPVSTATLGWANLPEGFDPEAELRTYIELLALGFLEDYLTFAPLPGGNAGTATQSLTLERKTRGKGPGLWQKLFLHMLNFQGVLPRTVTASYEERDVEQEIKEAQLAQSWATAFDTMIGNGTLTPKVTRQIMADEQIVLNDEYLALLDEEDATEDVTSTDEVPVADTGDIAPIDQAPGVTGEQSGQPGQPPAQPGKPPAKQPPPPPPTQSAAAPKGASGGSPLVRFFQKALADALTSLWLDQRRGEIRYYKADDAAGIDQIVGDFEAATQDALSGYMDGTYGRARAQRMFEAAIKAAWLPAAEAGYQDGGGDVDELESEDYTAIRQAESEQVDYARNFWASMPEIRKTEGDPLPRGLQYVSSLRAFYQLWRAQGKGNPKLQWHLGKTEEHCATCAKLDGTWHTLKWYQRNNYIPRKPGADMKCGGWQCDCYWTDKAGNEYIL